MAYVKPNILNDAVPGGDSIKEAIDKNDDNVDYLITSINAHDHSSGKGGTVDHVDLDNKGTYAHSEIDTNIVRLIQFYKTGLIPITGATISYTYTSGKLTGLTFGGTISGSATFAYTGDLLTGESWSVDGKTLTATHTYNTDDTLASTSITIA